MIDNFIGGVMEPYSYEDYLRDFVNCSSYFLKNPMEKCIRNRILKQIENVTAFQRNTSLILSFSHLNQGCKQLKSFHHQSKKSCPVL